MNRCNRYRLTRHALTLVLVCSTACNALSTFPAPREFEEPLPDAGGLDAGVGDAGVGDAGTLDAADLQDQPDIPDQEPDEGFVPGPISVERCGEAIKVRPRVRVAGTTNSSATVWISPQQNRAMIQSMSGFGATYMYPDLDANALVGATSTDLSYAHDGSAPFFYSVTRQYSAEDGIALYPTRICRNGCQAGDFLWATSVVGMRNTIYDGVPAQQPEARFWLGLEGDFVRMYMMSPGGTPDDQTSVNFCRADEADCVQPDPLEADSFGTSYGTVFMRDGNGIARAWKPGRAPAPVMIDAAPVRFDDFSAVAVRRNDSGDEYLFSHIRGGEEVKVYAARLQASSARTVFELTEIPFATVTGTDIWRATVTGSGGGVWHLITSTADGQVRVYLRSSGELQSKEQRTLELPSGGLRGWHASANLEGSLLESRATLHVAYIAGDDCDVDVETHAFSITRQ